MVSKGISDEENECCCEVAALILLEWETKPQDPLILTRWSKPRVGYAINACEFNENLSSSCGYQQQLVSKIYALLFISNKFMHCNECWVEWVFAKLNINQWVSDFWGFLWNARFCKNLTINFDAGKWCQPWWKEFWWSTLFPQTFEIEVCQR